MITVLIFIGLLVLGIVALILAFTVFDESETLAACGGVAGFIGFLGCLITGIWCISVNVPASVNGERYKLQEKIKFYQNEKEVIASFHTVTDGTKTEFTSDITLETLSTNQYYARVDKYNERIYYFKTDTMDHKYRKANPWTSWFESAAWDSITEEMLEGLSYTTGK